MLGAILHTIVIHWIVSTILQGRANCHSHIIDEETEAQKGDRTHPSHTVSGGAGFELKWWLE